LKFRSMRNDAEKDGTPRWASRDDIRVTRVGRIIRRSRIDELPQLWNVLRGDMSFVGPRPERPFFVDQLAHQVPYYGARHSVKPGITGWAQVRYGYGGSTEDAVRKLEFDLYYVKNHSLLLDVVILLKTIRVVFLGEGAR
jgi:lipopolysaccharide/colanic/teichoic acid biosynthesis glycosyltransferase